MKGIKRILVAMCICCFTIMLSGSSVYAAEGETQASTRSIIVVKQKANTPSSNVSVVATLTVSESQHVIIQVNNSVVDSFVTHISGIPTGIEESSISLSSPSIWDNGNYATITVTYRQNGVIKSEVCTFYPL